MKSLTFKTKDIFIEDPNDSNKTILQIPPEMLEGQNWNPGDTIKVSIGDQGTIILEKIEK